VASEANPVSKSVAVYIPAKSGGGQQHTRIWVNAEETEWINYVNRSAYLGAYVTTDLKDEEEIRGRIQKALGMYGCLRKHLLASKDVWYTVKKKVLTGMILPIMLDGAESWVVSATAMKELRAAYNRIVRGCCRVSLYTTRKHRITSASLQARLGVGTLEHYLDWRILGYAGHVMRMADGRLPKLIMQGRIEGNGRVGAPPKTHSKQLIECLRRKSIDESNWTSLTSDKTKWRLLVKKIVLIKRTSNTSARNKEKWMLMPERAVGRHVEQKFKSKFYVGVVSSWDLDKDTNELIWRVSFDDGDEGDYNARELQKIICAAEDAELYENGTVAAHGK
jgi:hypothetical protein